MTENKNSSQSLLEQVYVVKEKLDLVSTSSFEDCCDTLSASESAKLQVSLAYTLASLYYVLSKSNGVGSEHGFGILEDIERIKGYVTRLMTKNDSQTPKLKLDRAAKRMISHQLS